MTTPKAVLRILEAAGGRLVGRTRLQKSAYLLEAAGAGADFKFSYHHYGPYSEELSIASDDAGALGFITEEIKENNELHTYSVFEARSEIDVEDLQRDLMSIMNDYDPISLELAATAHFLRENGYEDDPWSETRRRKATKATDGRISKAQELLDKLGL